MIFLFKIGFLDVTWVDLIDIALVSVLLYQVYKLIRGSIAMNIFLGILALYLIYLIVHAAQMELLSKILGQFMGVGVLAMIILFQPEIRKFLLVIGRGTEFRENIFKTIASWRHDYHDDFDIQEIVEAAKTMKASKTGALIVFSRDSELKFYAPDRRCAGGYRKQTPAAIYLQQAFAPARRRHYCVQRPYKSGPLCAAGKRERPPAAFFRAAPPGCCRNVGANGYAYSGYF